MSQFLIGRQGNRYIVQLNQQYYLVDLDSQHVQPLDSELAVHRLVKHGYWTEDFPPGIDIKLKNLLHSH